MARVVLLSCLLVVVLAAAASLSGVDGASMVTVRAYSSARCDSATQVGRVQLTQWSGARCESLTTTTTTSSPTFNTSLVVPPLASFVAFKLTCFDRRRWRLTQLPSCSFSSSSVRLPAGWTLPLTTIEGASASSCVATPVPGMYVNVDCTANRVSNSAPPLTARPPEYVAARVSVWRNTRVSNGGGVTNNCPSSLRTPPTSTTIVPTLNASVSVTSACRSLQFFNPSQPQPLQSLTVDCTSLGAATVTLYGGNTLTCRSSVVGVRPVAPASATVAISPYAACNTFVSTSSGGMPTTFSVQCLTRAELNAINNNNAVSSSTGTTTPRPPVKVVSSSTGTSSSSSQTTAASVSVWSVYVPAQKPAPIACFPNTLAPNVGTFRVPLTDASQVLTSPYAPCDVSVMGPGSPVRVACTSNGAFATLAIYHRTLCGAGTPRYYQFASGTCYAVDSQVCKITCPSSSPSPSPVPSPPVYQSTSSVRPTPRPPTPTTSTGSAGPKNGGGGSSSSSSTTRSSDDEHAVREQLSSHNLRNALLVIAGVLGVGVLCALILMALPAVQRRYPHLTFFTLNRRSPSVAAPAVAMQPPPMPSMQPQVYPSLPSAPQAPQQPQQQYRYASADGWQPLPGADGIEMGPMSR